MIDKSAVIADGAILGADVEVGPFCMVGPNVKLGDRVKLMSHVVIDGDTEIGEDTTVWPFAAIGMRGQDLKFQSDDEMTGVKIGKRCRIREYVTIQSGTPLGSQVTGGSTLSATKKDAGNWDSSGTEIGDDCQIMVHAHVAHDCKLGNGIVVSNMAQLGGHVEIEDFAVISALSAVHQFCHIGRNSFLGAMAGTASDIPPYVIFDGVPARYRTINRVGLARRGFTNEDMHAIHSVYSAVFDGSDEAIEVKLKKLKKQIDGNQYALDAIDFLENRSNRRINTGRDKKES
ncbi:acyl-[acyl-carrier-protein]--UDP-N-acetylglucosamine O-acyltransferase [Spirochaetia bacterium]|nr:acyl-[acyl-carrier-protein]--UDP-N-acetylglucosamine O-acyltransferase [Spirochaetia bacterium]